MHTARVAAFAVIAALMSEPHGQAFPNSFSVGISGRIVKSPNTPVATATLQITDRTHQMETFPYRPEPITFHLDPSGRFAFRVRCNDEYSIDFSAPDVSAPFIEIGTLVAAIGPDVDLGNIVVQVSNKDHPTFELAGSRKASSKSARSKSRLVAAVLVTSNGALSLLLESGEIYKPAKEKDQVRFSSPDISGDRRYVGWLAEFRSCCTSYPVSWTLVVYRPGMPIRKFNGDDLGVLEWQILDWQFVAGGQRVAIYQDFLHGPQSQHYELRDVQTGRLIDQWNGELTPIAPEWTNGLGS